jgi:hypothetical protein
MNLFRTALLFCAAVMLHAGGFWLELGNPSASKDPAAKNAVLLVRAIGCGEPAKAGITATAEGIVDGRRVSLPVKLVALREHGLFAAERSWPTDGRWVLHLRGNYLGRETSTLAQVQPNGEVKRPGKMLAKTASAAEIDAMVRSE